MGSVGPMSIDDLGEICIANLRFPSWYFASHFMSELGFKSLFVNSLVWYECVCCYAEGRQAWGHCLLGRRGEDLVLSQPIKKKKKKKFGFILEAFGFSNHSL